MALFLTKNNKFMNAGNGLLLAPEPLIALGTKSLTFEDAVSAGDKVYANKFVVKECECSKNADISASPSNIVASIEFNGYFYIATMSGSTTNISMSVSRYASDGTMQYIGEAQVSYGALAQFVPYRGKLYIVIGSSATTQTSYKRVTIFNVTNYSPSLMPLLLYYPQAEITSIASALYTQAFFSFGKLFIFTKYNNLSGRLAIYNVNEDGTIGSQANVLSTPTYISFPTPSRWGYYLYNGDMYLGVFNAQTFMCLKYTDGATSLEALPTITVDDTTNSTTYGCRFFISSKTNELCAGSLTSGIVFVKIVSDNPTLAVNYEASLGMATLSGVIYDGSDAYFARFNVGIYHYDGETVKKYYADVIGDKKKAINNGYSTQNNLYDYYSTFGCPMLINTASPAKFYTIYRAKAKKGASVGDYVGVAQSNVAEGGTGTMTVYYATGGEL